MKETPALSGAKTGVSAGLSLLRRAFHILLSLRAFLLNRVNTGNLERPAAEKVIHRKVRETLTRANLDNAPLLFGFGIRHEEGRFLVAKRAEPIPRSISNNDL